MFGLVCRHLPPPSLICSSKLCRAALHIPRYTSVQRALQIKYGADGARLPDSATAATVAAAQTPLVHASSASASLPPGETALNNVTAAYEAYLQDVDNITRVQIEQELQIAAEAEQRDTSSAGAAPHDGAAVSRLACPGCGAQLHCRQPNLMGYITPNEMLDTGLVRTTLCQRCRQLRSHQAAHDVVVAPDEHRRVLAQLREQQGAIVVLLVDMLQMNNSVIPELIDVIGRRRILLVGTKVDLLPRDAPDWRQRWLRALHRCAVSHGAVPEQLLLGAHLVSAKTGWGVDALVNRLLTCCFGDRAELEEDAASAQFEDAERFGQLYLVGCANAGKSTLFNRLLASDLAKARAREATPTATVSVWPGTTLGLLRFPLLQFYSASWRRQRRWKLEEGWRERAAAPRSVPRAGSHLHLPSEPVVQTFLVGSEGRQDLSFAPTYDSVSSGSDGAVRGSTLDAAALSEWGAHEDQLYASRWCHDTPGLLSPRQLPADAFDEQELAALTPRAPLLPRTYKLRSGLSLLLGGLARFDLTAVTDCEAGDLLYMTVLSTLPVHLVRTLDANEYAARLAAELLVPRVRQPHEPASRLAAPRPHDVKLTLNKGWEHSSADVVLTLAGWVALTGAGRITGVAWTPGGVGFAVRRPALLPLAVNLRGARKSGTREFKTPSQATGLARTPVVHKVAPSSAPSFHLNVNSE